jgi:ribosomal protein L37E
MEEIKKDIKKCKNCGAEYYSIKKEFKCTKCGCVNKEEKEN